MAKTGADTSPAGHSALVIWGNTPVAAFPQEAAEIVEALPQSVKEGPFGAVAAGVAGSSPYLAQLMRLYPETVERVGKKGPEAALAELFGEMQLPAEISREALMRLLRQIKARAALVIALADLGGVWNVAKVTAALTQLAETAVGAVLEFLLRDLAMQGVLKPGKLPFTADNSGFFVLGMGKLGAGELNYSSDIDLMLLCDGEKFPFAGEELPRKKLNQLAADLTEMLQRRTADGYVFRVDLRLRPDPSSTPPVVTVDAALTYYESVGQNWERAALIKARPVAGDVKAAEAFLRELQPFIWRKYLDFATITDIQSIKRQIDSRQPPRGSGLDGFNLKLGVGGIRDIEFYVQTQQLIWGGKQTSLRVRGTCEGLGKLRAVDLAPPEAAEALEKGYYYLRRLEHAVQMLEDQQTHALPATPEKWKRLAGLLGKADSDTLRKEISVVLQIVNQHSRPLFEENKALSGAVNKVPTGRRNLVFTGVDDDPDTLETLRHMGFKEPSTVARLVRGWHHGHCPAMRTQRAREILTELMPDMLRAFAGTARPDEAFHRFDQFFRGLPAGVQLLSLFAAKPRMLALVADIFGATPRLAEMLSLEPRLLDRLLTADMQPKLSFRRAVQSELEDHLKRARDLEEGLHLCRQMNQEWRFLLGVRMLTEGLPAQKAAGYFTVLAEVMLQSVVRLVSEDFARQNPLPEGTRLAVLGFGKLGAGQMSFDSDLDLVFVYDSEGTEGGTEAYYNRLVPRILTACTALMRYGRLYAVDLRLRPYGGDAPKATRRETFRGYYGKDAWSYEWLALTRARPVAGDEALGAALAKDIRAMLLTRPEPKGLAEDLLALREKISINLAPKGLWDVKYQPGGLLDLEFLTQYLQLGCAVTHPEVLTPRPMEAWNIMALRGAVDARLAGRASRALGTLLTVHQWLRLCTPEVVERRAASGPALLRLEEVLELPHGSDQEALAARIRGVYEEGKALWAEVVGNLE